MMNKNSLISLELAIRTKTQIFCLQFMTPLTVFYKHQFKMILLGMFWSKIPKMISEFLKTYPIISKIAIWNFENSQNVKNCPFHMLYVTVHCEYEFLTFEPVSRIGIENIPNISTGDSAIFFIFALQTGKDWTCSGVAIMTLKNRNNMKFYLFLFKKQDISNS